MYVRIVHYVLNIVKPIKYAKKTISEFIELSLRFFGKIFFSQVKEGAIRWKIAKL
jgi:hypothetical protein